MKYLFFLDETGDHGLTFIDPNFPIFMLAGCLFEETEFLKTENAINELKMELFKTTEIIFHSRDIRKCDGPFQILFNLDLKKKFYQRLNNIISGLKFTIIGAGVNKNTHIQKYGKGARDPYSISLSFIIERLIFCLDTNSNGKVKIAIEKRGKRKESPCGDPLPTGDTPIHTPIITPWCQVPLDKQLALSCFPAQKDHG